MAPLNPNPISALVLTAAPAATYVSPLFPNDNCAGIRVVVDLTIATTSSSVVTIQMYDPISGKYVALLTSAALTAAATTVYTVYPGVTVAANVAVSAPLGRQWCVQVVVSDAAGTAAVTGTVSGQLCV